MPPSAEGVPVTFAEGVKADIAALVTAGHPIESGDVEGLRRRIAQLLVDCRANPYLGELMGAGRHPSLAACRRVRFDVHGRDGKPRFRLIYINHPTDGAPAECRWLAVGPRARLVAHRAAEARVPQD
jgi:hypothetical protein